MAVPIDLEEELERAQVPTALLSPQWATGCIPREKSHSSCNGWCHKAPVFVPRFPRNEENFARWAFCLYLEQVLSRTSSAAAVLERCFLAKNSARLTRPE